LSFFNLRVRGFEIAERGGKSLPQFAEGFHASGHASRKDLIEAMRQIDPEIVVPVHTEKPNEFLELDEFEVVLLEEGIPIEIISKAPPTGIVRVREYLTDNTSSVRGHPSVPSPSYPLTDLVMVMGR
jgi:mRNA degradation ribonuclease J1/J2